MENDGSHFPLNMYGFSTRETFRLLVAEQPARRRMQKCMEKEVSLAEGVHCFEGNMGIYIVWYGHKDVFSPPLRRRKEKKSIPLSAISYGV